jgi:DNA-binding CsgD family transcriptional regulator/tetratricopeptide (TPR) repeat protein
VSVVPAKTEMWLVSDTIHPNTTVLEECIGAGMLRSDGEALSFRHEMARRATEDSLGVPRRQHLHALVLTALLKRNSEELLVRTVHHAAQAGSTEMVLEYAPVAARQATALNAHREAAAHYGTALKYAGRLAPQQRAELLESRSYECYLAGQGEESLLARSEAVKLRKQLGDELRLGDNLRWMSRLSWGVGHREQAVAHGIEAVNVLENLSPSPELAMAYSNRAQLHMLSQEHQEVVSWGSRAIELAQKLGAIDTLAHALNNVGTAELFSYNESGRAKLEESLRLALANNFHDHAARAFTNLAFLTVRNRQYDQALGYLENGIAYATEHDLFYKLYMMASRARVYFDQGNWDAATDDAGFVLGHYRVVAITKMSALAVLGHVRVRRGDPQAVGALAEAYELAIQTGELQRVGPVASARAEFAWLNGSRDQLISEAQSVLDIAKGRDDPWIQEEFNFWLWRAGAVQENRQSHTTPYSLQSSGNWRAAAEAWRKIGCPYEQAIALADGDEPSQRQALEILEKLGARPAVEKVRQALRATGVRGIPRGPRPSTKDNAAGLTSRQVEVLRLMVEGLSNAEIATRLFISTRTVDHHVAAILAKLDTRTRAEAVSVALQTGLLVN